MKLSWKRWKWFFIIGLFLFSIPQVALGETNMSLLLNASNYEASLLESDPQMEAEALPFIHGFLESNNRTEWFDCYMQTWGRLIASERGFVWSEITPEQTALIRYPICSEAVFKTPNGKSYHSVNWCYTLIRSKTIDSVAIQEAMMRLEPCSKCVAHRK